MYAVRILCPLCSWQEARRRCDLEPLELERDALDLVREHEEDEAMLPSRSYVGRRTTDGLEVCILDRQDTRWFRDLDPRLKLRNHSPTGFECGYAGSGPAQLSLAILADCCGEPFGLARYQDFKFDVVARIPRDVEFEIPAKDVLEWAAAHPLTARELADVRYEIMRLLERNGDDNGY